MQHEHWRGCKEWKDEGLPLTTTSDEAARLYDAALTQLLSWTELESLGGLAKTLEDMYKADPGFVTGNVLMNTLNFMGVCSNPENDPKFRKSLDFTYDLCARSKDLTPREKKHVEALKCLDGGKRKEACKIWENILDDHPTDMMALKMAHNTYFLTGDQRQMKDSIERVFPKWKSSIPLYGYLYGMKAFALCENKQFHESEVVAKEGLRMNPKEIFCTHALAHDYEMTNQYLKGEKFLNETVMDWETCNMLSTHVHWHNALFSIEKGDFDQALHVFDEKICPSVLKSSAMLDLVDTCSLLYRLKMEGRDVKDQFKTIYDTCAKHDGDSSWTYIDLHFVMTFMGSGRNSKAEGFIQSVKNYLSKHEHRPDDYTATMSEIGLPVMNAIVAFDGGNFSDAVKLMNSVEKKLIGLGGSDPQRDVFKLLLINAAINSNDPDDQIMAEKMIKEREEKKKSPLTDRLTARFLSATKNH